MKFDPKKPHGVITNHEWARFEQDGVLYDCQGEPMDQIQPEIVETIEKDEPEVIASAEKKDFQLNQAQDFLKNILADGPLARSVLFKECQSNNQSWEKVKTAFANLGGEATKRRNIIYWKLRAE